MQHVLFYFIVYKKHLLTLLLTKNSRIFLIKKLHFWQRFGFIEPLSSQVIFTGGKLKRWLILELFEYLKEVIRYMVCLEGQGIVNEMEWVT